MMPRQSRNNCEGRSVKHFPHYICKWDPSGEYRFFEVHYASEFSCLLPYQVEQVSAFWKRHCELDVKTVVETSAHIGCDTVNIAKTLPSVRRITSFELDEEVCKILGRNIDTFVRRNRWNSDRFDVRQGDIVKALQEKKTPSADVYYFDPPWGGPDYIKQDSMSLFYSDVNVVELIDLVFKNNLASKVIIRLPKNYRWSDITAVHKLKIRESFPVKSPKEKIVFYISILYKEDQ